MRILLEVIIVFVGLALAIDKIGETPELIKQDEHLTVKQKIEFAEKAVDVVVAYPATNGTTVTLSIANNHPPIETAIDSEYVGDASTVKGTIKKRAVARMRYHRRKHVVDRRRYRKYQPSNNSQSTSKKHLRADSNFTRIPYQFYPDPL